MENKPVDTYLCGGRVGVDESGNIVQVGKRGRPSKSGSFGEPTVRISIPRSLLPAVCSLLDIMQRAHAARMRCLRSFANADPELHRDLEAILSDGLQPFGVEEVQSDSSGN